MTKPVPFPQAFSSTAQEEDCFDVALEAGPHLALKGPATERLKALTGVDVPYHGVLKRNGDDSNAYSDALGFVQKGLPPYCWDHDRPLFKESRRTKIWRTQSRPVDELLGELTSMNSEEVRWRNIIKLSEMEWLQGHQFQGQVLFPAAGNVPRAMDGALQLVQDQPLSLLELQDLTIHHAITMEDGSSWVEIVSVIKVGSSEFEKTIFTGLVVATLGDLLPDALAPRRLPMTDTGRDHFYMGLRKRGLYYSGDLLADSMKDV
ncbi:hypothetical protein DL765_003451 [Monosporascus sp. GIB2]|nr:hypothetical protein DL765_003451 [Monosporascus sp. GIB2]